MIIFCLNYRRMMKELVPADLHRVMSQQEWSRTIEAAYKRDQGMKPEDAKVRHPSYSKPTTPPPLPPLGTAVLRWRLVTNHRSRLKARPGHEARGC